ncbi:MAG: histidine kinase [Candidatus Dactylopiibacterium carminicum]|uniref:Oxygen sensor histidine kinase NreB n=1 Tax=Candidatus Dactylopiibacterium carminicum TaxID=857335 RepID=A0A272ETA9_9RHOO|nr:cache domain-containing protein [Candidatus Dactylopiibacterium carminicum]KAF7599162.1 histidine kinase [Candidatus Dactylopiibacterium carminicum]PAS93266.1 MAG: histidine kinase [Candidatus Dactylopiibacterium carminicum]PAS97099.1 MAG: histidine kinase [Candidatus Dactylopiibacterium carminicum]PAS99176.1 MAG: histidine kinase [Candidatus Dactylopiibacterium carminicum]
MSLRLKILLLAVAPLLLAAIAIAAVVRIEARALAEAETRAVLPVLESMRRAELKHYVDLAMGGIVGLRKVDTPAARAQALAVLQQLNFGEDGYFFVYDTQGRNLMHPRQPQLVGQDLWELRDPQGVPTIQHLIAQAREGGGYIEFQWNRPSTQRIERKLGYVELVPEWGWMLGTGIYLDDLEEARLHIDAAASNAIDATMHIIAVIAGAAMLIVAICGLALNLSTQRHAEARLRALAHQVVLSQETERARVARELHDGVSQLLVGVKYIFESVREHIQQCALQASDPLASMTDKGVARLNEVLREVRRISHDLRPTALDDLGLKAALAQTLDEFGIRTGLKVSFKAEDRPDLPAPVATALFRVVQEALTNIERHAGASEVSVSLMARPRALRLSISDNGRGFDLDTVAAQPRGGLGLASMRERIETLGGICLINSGLQGTSIDVVLPASALKP